MFLGQNSAEIENDTRRPGRYRTTIFPDTVRAVRQRPFCGVFEGSALERVELPSTLKRLGYKVFFGCGRLRSVRLPEQLEYIGKQCLKCARIY